MAKAFAWLWLLLVGQSSLTVGNLLTNKQLRGETTSRGIAMSCPVGTANYADTDWKPANLFKGFETAALILRKLGCKLPIYNVLYDDEADAARQRCDELKKHVDGISCIGMPRKSFKGEIKDYGYSKIFAVEAAPVNQVMFIDCDAFFVRDPTYMFDDTHFLATGALFWADIEGHFAEDYPHMEATLKLAPRDRQGYADQWWFRQGYDSGLLLVDKAASKKPFEFLLHMVSVGSVQTNKYDLKALSFGDKDLWHVAWLVAGPLCTDSACSLMPLASAVGECLYEDETFHMSSQSKLDRNGSILAVHQLRHWKDALVNPSELISINLVGRDEYDASGKYSNDLFYGFHWGGLIDCSKIDREFGKSARSQVSSRTQRLVKEVAACWLDDEHECSLRSI